jgi:hypothetical protein
MDKLTKLNAYARKLKFSLHAATISWPEAFDKLHKHAQQALQQQHELDMRYLTPDGALDYSAINAAARQLAARWSKLDLGDTHLETFTPERWHEFALQGVLKQAKHNQRLWELLQDA